MPDQAPWRLKGFAVMMAQSTMLPMLINSIGNGTMTADEAIKMYRSVDTPDSWPPKPEEKK